MISLNIRVKETRGISLAKAITGVSRQSLALTEWYKVSYLKAILKVALNFFFLTVSNLWLSISMSKNANANANAMQ